MLMGSPAHLQRCLGGVGTGRPSYKDMGEVGAEAVGCLRFAFPSGHMRWHEAKEGESVAAV